MVNAICKTYLQVTDIVHFRNLEAVSIMLVTLILVTVKHPTTCANAHFGVAKAANLTHMCYSHYRQAEKFAKKCLSH